MQKITQLVLEASNHSLQVEFDHKHVYQYDYEYLRVFSPVEMQTKRDKTLPDVYHKKQVQLLSIEPAGKHGYRFIFDDNHSAVYSIDCLLMLHRDHAVSWPQYLNHVKNSVQTREDAINFTQIE